MRIRWKLLILLLSIALVPASVAVWMTRAKALATTEDLATRARDRAVRHAKELLAEVVRDQSRMLSREGALLQHNLRVLAGAVEQALAVPAGVPGPAVPLAECADDPVGEARSRARLGYHLAAGIRLAEVQADLNRLATLLPALNTIHASQEGVIYWQYASLASGLHAVFPGAGTLPEGYDPRVRPWYLAACRTPGEVVSVVLIDAATRELVLTHALTVRGPSGEVAGVVGQDVRVADVVRAVELPPEWAEDAESLLVFLDKEADPADAAILVARVGRTADPEAWRGPVAFEVLATPDAAALRGVRDDLLRQVARVRDVAHPGGRSLWAYAPFPTGAAALLVTLPYERVVAPALQAEQEVRERLQRHGLLVAGILGGFVLTVIVLSWLATRQVTRPIAELAAAAERIAAGDFDTPTRITTRDELGELGATVNAMLPQLRERMRLKQALEVAMEVQQHLLPAGPPEVEGLDVAGQSLYCDETGGDYFDFIELARLGPHMLGVAVGDVTGHGIAAALLMASARALLRSRTDEAGRLADVVNHMNRHLAADVPVGRFMTLSYLYFDTRDLTVHWVNAGHDPALVYRPEEGAFEELAGGGIPLGIDGTFAYEEQGPYALRSGDVVVIGTDGIWEAHNDADEMFGKERLREVIRAHGSQPAELISQAITRAVSAFRGREVQNDDITLVVVKCVAAQ